MNVKIGENIKRLRKERNLTQEQLAAELEVSFQAVSRWELGTTYPGIGLLPMIARCFDVTVDELLGVDTARKEDEISDIYDKVHELNNKGKVYDAICLLKEKIREYPYNAELMSHLGQCISYYNYSLEKEDKNYESYAREAIEWSQKALKYSKNPHTTDNCRQTMIFSYINLGEYEKAREIAEDMSDIYATRDMLLPAATKDREKELFLHQVNVVNFTDILVNEIWQCVDFTNGPVEKQLELKLMLEKVMLTVLGENPCFYNERLYDISISTAWEYTKLKRYEEAMDNIEKALQYAENFEERHTEDRYSVFWLDKLTSKPDAAVKNYEGTLYDKMEEHLQNMCYHDGYYEDNARFNEIRDKVAAHRKG